MPPKKVLQVVFFLLTIVNGLFYFATIITLLQQYVGDIAYVLWIVVAPFLSPAIFGLPWFNAWVGGTAVNVGLFLVWALWIAAICALAFCGFASARARKSRG